MMKKNIINIVSALCLVCGLSACVDTVILPESKTVDEDFWQTKSDVSSMVNGAYQGMISSDVIARMIVWGDFRADELVPVTTISSSTITSLNEIYNANTQTDNTYATWSSLYSVINRCNIVLAKAEPVMEIDPDYTEGDYLTHCSQMKALRALCYFYLVRVYRDVPYTTTAYMNSSQDLDIVQSAPDSVLQACIADLVDAEANALDPSGYNDWKKVGYLNRDGIDAILADIYLWLASVHYNESVAATYYQKCVEYCDKVIESKKAQHTPGRSEVVVADYPLADGSQAYNEIFVEQNAEESIFELQMDGNNNSNTSLCQMYYKYANNNSTSGFVKASSIFGSVSTNTVYDNANDYRYWNGVYRAGSGDETFNIRKMVAEEQTNTFASTTRTTSRTYANFAQNFIIYRLTDVMLMKAEALSELAASKDDIQLRQAFNLVQYVNSRSRKADNLSDSLKWNTYSSKESMETLILSERLRELCFEGKRWYDLMRYNYRHITASDYGKTLAQLEDEGFEFPTNAQVMLNLVTRKYASGGSSVAAKLRTEPLLYMPIPRRDTEICPQLRQNPAYSDSDTYEKNI